MPNPPEQHVIDEIDCLVTESIEHGYTCDYDAPFKEACELCGFEWHGKPNGIGCPGAYSSDEQREKFKTGHQLVRQFVIVPDDGSPPWRFIGHVQPDVSGDSDGSPDLYTFNYARSYLSVIVLQQDSDDTVLGDTP